MDLVEIEKQTVHCHIVEYNTLRTLSAVIEFQLSDPQELPTFLLVDEA